MKKPKMMTKNEKEKEKTKKERELRQAEEKFESVEKGSWLLDNFERDADDKFSHTVTWEHPSTGKKINTNLGKWSLDNVGNAFVLGPLEGHTLLDYTGGAGKATGAYYGLVFQLPKWRFKVFKFDESLEVSPVHAQYYQITLAQKDQLEQKIKAGLGEVARSVGDYELVKHDERRYREFMDYFERKDEHSLRSVFIDQVDMPSGDVSIRNIISRWPSFF